MSVLCVGYELYQVTKVRIDFVANVVVILIGVRLMLVPKVKASEFKKFGFKRCKGIPKESECYYLCIARGCKMLFVSNVCFAVNDWNKDDPRIHKNANCRYRDNRTALDIIYELIKADMLKVNGSEIDETN